MDNHSINEQEQLAIKYHTSHFGVHVFYIRDMKEYLTMLPFTKIFPNVKLIIDRKLREDLFKEIVNKKPKRKRVASAYTKIKDIYLC